MKAAGRYRLLGTYRTPKVRVGTVLSCEARDCDVIVTCYTDARIPWPKGRRKGATAVGPVVSGDLARNLCTESDLADRHWFYCQWAARGGRGDRGAGCAG
jgi:hypothetical protein